MAKFNIEIELDWLDEETSIDEALKEEILSSIQARVTADATVKFTNKLNAEIEAMSKEIVDQYIGKIMADKIENMKVPYKKNTFSSDFEFIPMSEFIGMRYEEYLNKKVFDEEGREARYSSDRKVSINEFFINKYLEKELTAKVNKLIQKARQDAEETIIKTLEQNLKAQLSVDIIKRLDIPNMLKSLEEKARLIETKEVEK